MKRENDWKKKKQQNIDLNLNYVNTYAKLKLKPKI